ncbi:hypothetical protein D3C73_1171680 [compost metagenome]
MYCSDSQHDGHGVAQRATADITHEDPRLREIEWQKTQARQAKNNGHQRIGPGQHGGEAQRNDDRLTAGNPVDPIHEVPDVDQ